MTDTQASPILLVEDDHKLAQLIIEFLQLNGFVVHHIDNGERAAEYIIKTPPQLVILDVMLPGMDGLAVCRKVRPVFSGPIVMLTALNDDIDEVAGLETGADDYLGKPVKPRVLLAHIRALLRRLDRQTSDETDEPSGLITSGPININTRQRTVTVNDLDADLTTSEYNLLLLLAEKKGQVVSRDYLHQQIFRLEFDGLDRTIDIRISRLRKKLGDDSKSPQYIKTVRGEGYLLVDN